MKRKPRCREKQVWKWRTVAPKSKGKLTSGVGSWGRVSLASVGWHIGSGDSRFGSINIGFLLKFTYVLLVPDSLISKPVWYLEQLKRRGSSYHVICTNTTEEEGLHEGAGDAGRSVLSYFWFSASVKTWQVRTSRRANCIKWDPLA